MWVLFRAGLQLLGYGLGGWALSDMYNESQRTQQAQSGKTPTQDTSTSGNFFSMLQEMTGLPRWLLWLVVLIAAAYAIKNLFKRRSA